MIEWLGSIITREDPLIVRKLDLVPFPNALFYVTMYLLFDFSNYKVIFTNAENIHEICCNILVSQEIA